jgi:hypothetical protein
MADTLLDQRLLSLLQAEGPKSPAELISYFQVSQPTLFRWVKAQSQTLVTLGAARNRKLAALRAVRGLNSRIPVFQVSNEGKISSIGNLVSLYPSQSVFVPASSPSRPTFYPGLPFFLDDAKPQGFLGRSFGRKHSDLRLPPRISDWNNDDILEAIARRGEDLVGNLLVGDESFERYQLQYMADLEMVEEAQVCERYCANAQAAMDGHPSGSSAGGEQPKFGATLRQADGTIQKVLVKFSPAGDSFPAERWRDLLLCEFLALQLLSEHGILSVKSRILETGGRIFLETIRFDRVGLHGRRGVLSIGALENEFTGQVSNWAASAETLCQKKKISSEDLRTIQRLECFGRLIANSDRHPGNLSFFWSSEDGVTGLTPVYDMLPMLYAPFNGEDVGRIFTLPTYEHTLLDAWKSVVSMAVSYWERVHEDTRISEKFRKIAESNAKLVKRASDI